MNSPVTWEHTFVDMKLAFNILKQVLICHIGALCTMQVRHIMCYLQVGECTKG